MTTYRPGYVPGKTKMSVYVDPGVHRALKVRAAETGESMGDIVERALRRELGMERLSLGRDEFAAAMGFADYEALMAASESVVTEGDVDWFITQLPDGRWAAWDDAELALDRVAYFATREEAAEFHRDAYGCILVLDDYLTQYSGREAVCLPWEKVENLLGGYDDTEEDDEKLISLLREMPAAKGRPKWIDDPATRKVVTDDAGWWLVGPRVED